jgi:neutral ceramidase
MLRAGIARCCITPPLGMTMAGYAAREGVAEGKDTELYATALILESGESRIAIVALDLLFLQDPLVSNLRQLLGERIHVSQSNVLLNFSHTHCGPTSDGLKYDDDERQAFLRREYAERLRAELSILVDLAAHRLEPARLGSSKGEARIGINRRQRQTDGSILLGENAYGPVDHEVSVLRIDDLKGKPIAAVVSHGCHTVTMGPKCLLWSSDYVGPARDLIEKNTGALSLFLQGSAGDINPITGIGATQNDNEEKKRLGLTLGAEVLKVYSSIYTDSVRGGQVLVGALSKIPFYPRLHISEEQNSPIAAIQEFIDLPLEEFPDASVASELSEKWDAEISTLLRNNVKGGPLNAARLFHRWSKILRSSVDEKLKPVLTLPIQALRVGDVAIVGVPGETFCEQGMSIKTESPFAHTLFLGYSNGCASYIPTPDAYPRNGWSVTERYYVPDMIFQAYLLPTALRPMCGNKIVEKSLELLGRL